MIQFFKKPYRFGIVYGVILTLATAYIMLDTFVIPKKLQPVGTQQSESTTTSVTTASTADGTDTDSETGEQTAGESSAESTTTEIIAPVYTENSYKDGNISITITTARIYDTTYYAADIVLSDISYLKTAFAENTYGRNIKAVTSETAAENNAIIAINGDYYGFRDFGYVIRNKILYRDVSSGNEDLAIMSDGTFKIFTEGDISAADLYNESALQAFSFGPGLVIGGETAVGENEEVARAMASNPRTAIGIISPLHYVFLVSDGRTDESEGLSLYQLAEVMNSLGCTEAYNLDGGGSATMVFNGSVVNIPTDGSGISERSVSDIVYIGY